MPAAVALVALMVAYEKKTGGGVIDNAAGVRIGQQNGVLADVPNFRAFDDLFLAYGQQFKVDPLLLKALAIRESSLNPAAVNDQDKNDPSYGLMQISCIPDGVGGCRQNEFRIGGWPPPNGPTDLMEPAVSVRYAAEIMSANLWATRGDVWQAVAMYNSGQRIDPVYVAAVKKWYYLMGGAG